MRDICWSTNEIRDAIILLKNQRANLESVISRIETSLMPLRQTQCGPKITRHLQLFEESQNRLLNTIIALSDMESELEAIALTLDSDTVLGL